MKDLLSVVQPLIMGGGIILLIVLINLKKLDDKRNGIMGVAISVFLLWAVALILKNPAINPVYTEGISFLGIFLLTVSTTVITFIIEVLKKKKDKE